MISFVNGEFVEASDAKISIADLGLLRGYGVFDYVSVYDQKAFHLDDHIDRLYESAKKVRLDIPYSKNELKDIFFTFVLKNPPVNGGVRILITGGQSSKDYLLAVTKPSVMMLFHPFNGYPDHIYSQGMKAITQPMLRLIPSVKSTNYLPAIFAMQDAQQQGYHDAIYLSSKNELLEGTTSNVFFIKKDTLYTDDSDLIVKGITRLVALKVAKQILNIQYQPLKYDELKECDEAFFTSSIKDAMPLTHVDDIPINHGKPGPITAMIREGIIEYRSQYLESQSNIGALV